MSKRHETVLKTTESKSLLVLRIKSDLSVRDLADKMGISKTRVSQMESGLGNISEEYISKFLKALNLNWFDWDHATGKDSDPERLRDRCHDYISEALPSQLRRFYEMVMKD